MKLISILALLFSVSAFSQSNSQSTDPEYHKNDGSARPGNPGTFTPSDANSIENSPEEKMLNKQEKQEQQAKPATEDRVLDMSTSPDSGRTLPSGEKVKMEEE